ncbi:hypothetical protein CYMTET_34808, partial [Cymbomonas tetramitiformis]
VRREVRAADQLSALHLAPGTVRKAMTIKEGDSSVRIDIRSEEHLTYVNNIEEDAMYNRWPEEVTQLLRPRYPGRMPTVRKNLFNAVFFVDGASEGGLAVADVIITYVQQFIPVRMGIVVVSSKELAETVKMPEEEEEEEEDEEEDYESMMMKMMMGGGMGGGKPAKPDPDTSHKVARLFYALKLAADERSAVLFLQACNEQRDVMGFPNQRFKLQMKDVQGAWKQTYRNAIKAKTGTRPSKEDTQEAFKAALQKDSGALQPLRARAPKRCPAPSAREPAGEGACCIWGCIRGEEPGVADPAAGARSIPELRGRCLWGFRVDGGFRAAATQFAIAKGMTNLPVLAVNGEIYTEEDAMGQGVEAILMPVVNREANSLAGLVHYKKIDDDTNVLDYLMQGSGVPRFNPLMLPHGRTQPEFELVKLDAQYFSDRGVLSKLPYLTAVEAGDDVAPVSQWVVADLGLATGRALMAEAARRLTQPSCKARIALLLNSQSDAAAPLSRVVHAAAGLSSRRHKLPGFLQELLAAPAPAAADLDGAPQDTSDSAVDAAVDAAVAEDVAPLSAEEVETRALELAGKAGLNVEELRQMLANAAALDKELADQRAVVTELLALGPGDAALVTNGKMLRAPPSEQALLAEDIALGEVMEYRQRAQQLEELVLGNTFSHTSTDELTSAFYSHVIMTASLIISTHQASATKEGGRGHQDPDFVLSEALQGNYSGVLIEGDSDSLVEIQALVDPLSPKAQRLAPLLVFLSERIGATIRLFLNPDREISDVPLKSFYRYVLPAKGMEDAPGAYFTRLPASKVLTMAMDVPESWLVSIIANRYDSDNIKLEDLNDEISAVNVEYQLDSLMVTGHTTELRQRQPPRGVQLELGDSAKPDAVGTIIMSNLGYFQLKSAPGVWNLRLKPGRSSELYTIDYMHPLGPQKPKPFEGDVLQTQVVVSSFDGAILRMQLRRQPGKEGMDVLQDSEEGSKAALPEADPFGDEDEEDMYEDAEESAESSSLWNRAMNLLGTPSATAPPTSIASTNETIHIFSVASGHLYERLLKIMVLSVLSHTQNPVKFWFISNYLSPQFRDFIPHMAKEHSFEYELVTYKWPSWLHKQTEKQRIIWAYKILFLDVLFPLDLHKVIYVDADQIVRTDIAQLWNTDLQGRALAYTPFCDNNKDMEGFRFWKQGFWKDHLRGRPYHISALYVVDLDRFRQTAAGDPDCRGALSGVVPSVLDCLTLPQGPVPSASPLGPLYLPGWQSCQPLAVTADSSSACTRLRLHPPRGDQLRVVYDNLSKDPNSLANLDQDLPNYAQHQVPIFSLPQPQPSQRRGKNLVAVMTFVQTAPKENGGALL